MEPPDYWPDARRIPKEQLKLFVDTIRSTRESLGVSNATLCREVRALINAHNAIPGRDPVAISKIADPREYGEQGKTELAAIRKGTRKYIVGYLAWLCLRNEDAARALYDQIGLPFRPYREDGQAAEMPPARTRNTVTRDEKDEPADASERDQFLVYEIAFLWYGFMPPPAQEHESAMTPEIAQLKNLLHTAIDLGKLNAVHFQAANGGYARLVDREDLRQFAEKIGSFPQFLFPDRNFSPDDASAKFAKLAAELDEQLLQLPEEVTDWTVEYSRYEWAVYEAAFLWHGFVPPPMAMHERVMPELVRQTKQMLHDAANSHTLTPALDNGVRMRNVMVYGTRHVTRPELRRFATSIGQRPHFLFPEDEGKTGH